MGVVKFDIGEVANAGLGDGIGGAVQDIVDKLPKDALFWLDGSSPSSYAPYAEFHEGRFVIDIRGDDRQERAALGIKTFEGMEIKSVTEVSTIFTYSGATYEVKHRTQPNGCC